MVDEKKVLGYTVKNSRPVYSDEKEKEKAEQNLIKNILNEYNKVMISPNCAN